MKNLLLALPILALCTACSSTGESSSNYGTGINSSGGTATGSITQRRDGNYALILNVSGGYCTAVYDNPSPGGRELKPLVCSGGNGGNATVVYGSDARPERATYGGVGIGSGTITF